MFEHWLIYFIISASASQSSIVHSVSQVLTSSVAKMVRLQQVNRTVCVLVYSLLSLFYSHLHCQRQLIYNLQFISLSLIFSCMQEQFNEDASTRQSHTPQVSWVGILYCYLFMLVQFVVFVLLYGVIVFVVCLGIAVGRSQLVVGRWLLGCLRM